MRSDGQWFARQDTAHFEKSRTPRCPTTTSPLQIPRCSTRRLLLRLPSPVVRLLETPCQTFRLWRRQAKESQPLSRRWSNELSASECCSRRFKTAFPNVSTQTCRSNHQVCAEAFKCRNPQLLTKPLSESREAYGFAIQTYERFKEAEVELRRARKKPAKSNVFFVACAGCCLLLVAD